MMHATDTEALHLVSNLSGCVRSGLAGGSDLSEELGHGATKHIGALCGRIRWRRGDLVDGSDMELQCVRNVFEFKARDLESCLPRLQPS